MPNESKPDPELPKRRSFARTTGGGYRAGEGVVADIHLEHHPQSPLPYVAGPNTYRCIAFDGGPNTLTYLRCLLELEKRIPGFVDRTDLFAGTSDGAFAAAFLASHERIGEPELRACIAMIEDVLSEAITPNHLRPLQGALANALGRLPFFDREKVRADLDAPLRAASSLNNVARLGSGPNAATVAACRS